MNAWMIGNLCGSMIKRSSESRLFVNYTAFSSWFIKLYVLSAIDDYKTLSFVGMKAVGYVKF